MAPGLQAKLLRVLENGQYRRVGSTQENQANVRVIAATNKVLEDEMRAGRFREALPHLRLAAAMKRHADYDDAVRRVEEWLGKSEPA